MEPSAFASFRQTFGTAIKTKRCFPMAKCCFRNDSFFQASRSDMDESFYRSAMLAHLCYSLEHHLTGFVIPTKFKRSKRTCQHFSFPRVDVVGCSHDLQFLSRARFAFPVGRGTCRQRHGEK